MDCDGYPRIPMPLMCTAFVPGQIDAAVAGISNPDSRAIATAEALYFRGQATLAAKTARPYVDATDPALRYSACFICGYASLSLNRIADARRCLAGILDTPTDEESPAVHATHILFASAASVLLHLPSPYSAEEFYPLAAHLPEGLRLFASYVMAHALYLRGEYGRSLGYNVIPLAELLERGIAKVFAEIRAHIGDRPVYLSYDMDFFDPSVAPGVCTPTWGGATSREGLAVLEACAGLNLVGVNINTVSPPHDVGGMSALLAAQVTLNALNLIARQHQSKAAGQS